MADPHDPISTPRQHWIKPTWLRRTLTTLLWIIIAVILLPLAIYIPFVQDFAVRIAEDTLHKSTGMKIGVGQFRLSFPLDVKLRDVTVIEASGDTMVTARELIADIKLLPLLGLDVDVNKVSLRDGYYRMTAPDSSMLLTVRARYLELDDSTTVDLKTMEINLNRTLLRNGRLDLVMDVWKKKHEPEDTAKASTPITIRANRLDIDNFAFGMSMLPTIDTMDVAVKKVEIRGAEVDLGKNLVHWKKAAIGGGNFTYLAPTPEYVRTHPAPPSEPSSGPPMRIIGDIVAVDSLQALYGVKGAKPMPGFDPGYLQFSGVNIGLSDFYNESSTVRVPLTRLEARERSGLQVVSGKGTVGIDSLGLTLKDIDIKTLYSAIKAEGDIPFAMMAMEPSAPMAVNASGKIGLPDVEAFAPVLKTTLAHVPKRVPLDFDLSASGSISSLDIPKLKLSLPGVVRLDAKGFAKNPLDYKKLVAALDFSGALTDPAVADAFIPEAGFKLPAFSIDGKAQANGMSYGADFSLKSDAGDVAAKGHVALTPETYNADIHTSGLDIGRFMPDLGIGRVTAVVNATGRGFNPLTGTAVTDATVNVTSVEYRHQDYRDILVKALLTNAGDLDLDMTSNNPGLDFSLKGTGTIHPDDYRFDLQARLRDIDLQALGLSDTTCFGSGDITLVGAASPSTWTYNADLSLDGVEWNLPDRYIHLPDGLTAEVRTNPLMTSIKVDSQLTTLAFHSDTGPEALIRDFTKAADLAVKQVGEKNVVIDELTSTLPKFDLTLNAAGRGLIDQFLSPTGMAIDTVYAAIRMDSILTGNIGALNLSSPTVNLDTMTLNLSQRGSLIDYKAHLGNRPGTMDEFAKVNVNGYLGDNRLSAFLNQWNIKGEQGYRIGVTASYADSTLNAHITPLKSTIAYMPWTFNADNFLDYNIFTNKISANLSASSAESSITAKTQDNGNGSEELYVGIENLHIEDFLQMWAFAPPIAGDLNTDLHLLYEGRRFKGNGTVLLRDFTYEKTRIGTFDLDLDAVYGLESSTDLNAALRIDNKKAVSLFASLVPAQDGMKPDSVGLSLTKFPLEIANPFLGQNLKLSGYLNGDMRMDGSFSSPILNGAITFDSVNAYVPIAAANLRLNGNELDIKDNVLTFENFNIFGANKNPIAITGTVNARDFSNPAFNLNVNADNFQLINSDARSRADLYGKIFLTMNASVKGKMSMMDVGGNVDILGKTDATYQLNMVQGEISGTDNSDVVKFVNFNDTLQIAKADSIENSAVNMRINAGLTISAGTQIQVLLSDNGTDKLELQPTANLKFHQNYMGDMSLNGALTLGEGFGRYALPVIGEKKFTFNPSSTITWNGPIANPTLNVEATDDVRANVSSGNNSRLVNFLVTLVATNTVSNLKVAFDLSTNDDLAIQNELQSMSADQRQTQAMNLLLYGQYMGQNVQAKAAGSNFLYGYIESTLNSWAAQNIRGVDLTFGVDQYDKVTDGVSNTETSYSYQVSKSLFNNKFKINVGGNYSTDAADDEIAQNLVSDVSLEYVLKQTQNMNMDVRIFRHSGFESILEGEVTEMGVGFVYKRRLQSLRGLFHFGKKKKKNLNKVMLDSARKEESENRVKPDSSAILPKDSL